MTLKDIITSIEAEARKQPAVASIVRGDVYKLNAQPAAKYGVFAWLQGSHTLSLSTGLIRYSFTFFYVDKLQNDEGNELDAQSAGISVLSNILQGLEGQGIEATSDLNFQPFTQRFSDNCAGVFVSTSFEVPNSVVCAEDYPLCDFNNDFNNDFSTCRGDDFNEDFNNDYK